MRPELLEPPYGGFGSGVETSDAATPTRRRSISVSVSADTLFVRHIASTFSKTRLAYRAKNFSSRIRHSGLLVILIKARSSGFLIGLCSGNAIAI